MRQFIIVVFLSFLVSCDCETYDPNHCVYCQEPRICVNGYCVCDTNEYFVFAGFCEPKGYVTYYNTNIDQPCISDQIILDSVDFFGQKFDMDFKEDSVYVGSDQFNVYARYNFPDGDSMVLVSAFTEKYIQGVLCKPYLYCKERGIDLFVKAYWREIANPPHILDSCSFMLYRDKL